LRVKASKHLGKLREKTPTLARDEVHTLACTSIAKKQNREWFPGLMSTALSTR
jgi:hypothetical protein